MATETRRAPILLVTIFLLAAGCVRTPKPGPEPTAPRQNERAGTVELLRDQWGVPHVFAKTDAAAMYGLGYATAQDRAFQMYYNLRIIQGRLAEVVGDVTVGVTRQRPEGDNSALRSDVTMRTIGYFRAAQETASRIDPEARALLEAYSRGVNDYVTNHRDQLLDLFEKYDLQPEPWTPAACIASWSRMALFFAGDGLREAGAYYEITDGNRQVRRFAPTDSQGPLEGLPVRDDASVIQRGDVDEAWARQVTDYALEHKLTRKADVTPARRALPPGPRFSHAWVVGRDRTSDGSAVLVSDPQTLVRNPSLFYEFHISGKTFNARGIGIPGSPGLLIGFTPSVAWGLTALGADQADLFLLRTDPNRPNQYRFDDQWRDMDVRTETIQVKGGRARSITVRQTHLGPVVTDLAMGVRGADQFALKRIPICEPEKDTFVGALAMMRARDVHQFEEALGQWRFPSANCVFADRQGNIGYKTILALPVRSADSLLDGMAADEGWTSASDWQGILPHELLPQVINPRQGYLVSANHRPIASFYPIAMGNSTGSLGDTDRSWRLKERVGAKAMFTPAEVLDMHYDSVAPIKRDLVKLGYHLRDVQQYRLEEETLLALDYLKGWYAAGCRMEMSIVGTEILNLMPMAFRRNFAAATIYGGGVSGLCNMLQTLNERIAQDANAWLTDEEADYVNLILRAAWRYGKATYGDDPSQWNARARAALTETTMPYMSTLDGFGSLDAAKDLTFPALSCIEGGTILSQKSQSYTQYVPMGDPDGALALLPIGHSEHPDSAHRLGGYELWAQGKLRAAPLSRQAVEKLTISRTALEPSAQQR